MRLLPIACLILLTACQPGGGQPGVTAEEAEAFDGIGPSETIFFLGNEPFWGGNSEGETLIYTTPENPDGIELGVTRFAGLNGIGLTGTLADELFIMAVTEAQCSDTMSDRTYPFTVTLKIGEDVRSGCAWTKASPFSGDPSP